MSRCRACDVVLQEEELKRKAPNGEYEDMCNRCGISTGYLDGAEYNLRGDIIGFRAVPEAELRFEYAGGVGSIDYVDFWLEYDNSKGNSKKYEE